MIRTLRLLSAGLWLVCAIAPAYPQAFHGSVRHARRAPAQETGFLNRTLELHGASYRFQVYLPESFRRDEQKPWPVILFLHGRGERGSEGMWQTQIGLPEAVRDHPERWPFVIVMPQCPQGSYWTDPEMLRMAMTALDRETQEFHLDTERTYLTGLSLGGCGHRRRRHLLELCAGALAAGLDAACRVCARGGPPAALALPRQPGQCRRTAPERVAL
jgi:poly(3-hydroxybutyrate) depolymerase